MPLRELQGSKARWEADAVHPGIGTSVRHGSAKASVNVWSHNVLYGRSQGCGIGLDLRVCAGWDVEVAWGE